MPTNQYFRFETSPENVPDNELIDILRRAFVGGGFTSAERAEQIFQPDAIKARGDLICAWTDSASKLAGIVIVVMPDSPARRLANPDEAELHLLAVDPVHHGLGLGRALVSRALDLIESRGLRNTVLWTQPKMLAAQKLYENLGFIRNSTRDPTFEDTQFLVYELRR